MGTKKRLINCDFLNTSAFISNVSNKAKLLYFMFLTNADDKGFVGNAIDIANTLDMCEENFDNTLFNFKYVDALNELVDKRLCYEFKDKVGNKIYLIRHWFMHQSNLKNQFTNYYSLLVQVELDNGEYHLKLLKGETMKGKEKKGNDMIGNKISNNTNIKVSNDSDTTTIEKEKEKDSSEQWETFMKELADFGKEKDNGTN